MHATRIPDTRTFALPRASVSARPWQLMTPQSLLRPVDVSPPRPTRREFLIGAAGLLFLPAGGSNGAEDGPVYGQLREVAPTVVVPYDGGAEGESAMWREPLRIIARTVGREERGEEVLSEIDAKMENARERLSGFGDLTVSIFTAGEGY